MVLLANIGSSNAYVSVGIPRDGIDLDFTPFNRDVKSDAGGGPEGDAVEIIHLNDTVIIKTELSHYAGVYVNKLRAMSQGSATEGTMVAPGTLLGAAGMLPSVKFTSNDIDGGFLFTNVNVRKPGGMKQGTSESTPSFEFRAINFLNVAVVTSIVGNVLYSKV
jgi:hypothetical protein